MITNGKDCFMKKVLCMFGIMIVLILAISANVMADSLFRSGFNYLSAPANSLLNPGNFMDLNNHIFFTSDITYRMAPIKLTDHLELSFTDHLYYCWNESKNEIKNRMNELFVTYAPNETVFVDIGKVMVTKGVGFFKNPADFLVLNSNDVALFDSFDGRSLFLEGRTMIRTQFFLPRIGIDLIYSPQITWDESGNSLLNYLSSRQSNSISFINMSGNIDNIDLNGTICYDRIWKLGFNVSSVIGESFEVHMESALEEKWDQKVLKDYISVLDPDAGLLTVTQNWTPSIIIGGHYTLKNGSNFMVEYFYNGKGYNANEWFGVLDRCETSFYNYSDPLKKNDSLLFFSAMGSLVDYYGIPGMVKHYAMLRYFTKMNPKTQIEIININNLVDLSGIGLFQLKYGKNNYVFYTNVSLPYGNQKSEFKLMNENYIVRLGMEINF